MELFRQLDDKQTNGQTDGLTELFLKSAIATEKTVLGLVSILEKNKYLPLSTIVVPELMGSVFVKV